MVKIFTISQLKYLERKSKSVCLCQITNVSAFFIDVTIIIIMVALATSNSCAIYSIAQRAFLHISLYHCHTSALVHCKKKKKRHYCIYV